MDGKLREKYEHLCSRIRVSGSMAVAFSGGTDSSLLLRTAHDVLGDLSMAVIAESVIMPEEEQRLAEDFCRKMQVRFVTVKPEAPYSEEFRKNPPDRCYFCKRDVMGLVKKAAEESGMACVAEGTNADDPDDFRPGMKAVRELGILSPLKEAGLTKKEIREISRELGISVWDKPSSACLASRFAYGEYITDRKLSMVAAAERMLRKKGLRQLRVRMTGENTARIEVPTGDFSKVMEENFRRDTVTYLKQLGFIYITLDLEGFRSGSMNEALSGGNVREK